MSLAPPAEPRPARASVWGRIARALRTLSASEADAAMAEALRAEAESPERHGERTPDIRTEMLLRAARFDRLPVADVMTPRADIVAVEVSTPLSELARIFTESQHSRLPVFRETLDDPLGFVHVKDVMALLAPDEHGAVKAKPSDRVLPRLRREVLFAPASMRLANLLLKMRSTRIHVALVVDEYGGTDGLVSIEDVVEQIVGDIDDEYDIEDSPMILPRGAGAFEADGRASIEHLEKALGVSLALPEDEQDFDTAAGLAVALVGRVPQRGEALRHPAGFDIEVLDADPRRVKRLRIRPKPAAASEGDKGSDGA